MKKDSVRYAASYAARGGIFSALGVLLLLSAHLIFNYNRGIRKSDR